MSGYWLNNYTRLSSWQLILGHTAPLNVYGTNWKRGVISKEPVTAMQEMKCVHYWSEAGTFHTNPLCVLSGIVQLICKSRWCGRWQMADCTDCCSRQRGNLCPADHLAFHAVTNMLIKGTKCMFSLWVEHGYDVTEITLKYLYLSIYPIRVDGLSIHARTCKRGSGYLCCSIFIGIESFNFHFSTLPTVFPPA